MTEDTATKHPSTQPPNDLGARLRHARAAAGLTQGALAGERFSKEYVSQIERGKTRPTQETVAWLAGRLGIDAAYLESGVSIDERGRIELLLTRADALVASRRFDEAVACFAECRDLIPAGSPAVLELRALQGEAWARIELGDVHRALTLLADARALAETPGCSDVDRADVLFRLGVARYRLSSIATAVALFDEALVLADRSDLPCDLLRADILGWRSRCRRRQRDFEAAREDVERALELARALDDPRVAANTYFQASLVAERMGHLILSQKYAQRAKELYQELDDDRNVGGLMVNLGGLNLLLQHPEKAIEHFQAGFSLAVESGSQPLAAQAVGSLATAYLELENYDAAEESARKALALLEGRDDYPHEVGPTLLVLGRSLMERGRLDEAEQCFQKADSVFQQMESVSHRAGAWVALGDLASRRGSDREAARLYRDAAQALQDFRF
jgi:tetratricopeptide (TPR) repeat protein